MADQVKGSAGPNPDKDAPVITPEEINRGGSTPGPGVDDDNLIAAERLPRLDNEDDQPDSDALGG